MFDKIQMILMMETTVSKNGMSRLNKGFDEYHKWPLSVVFEVFKRLCEFIYLLAMLQSSHLNVFSCSS